MDHVRERKSPEEQHITKQVLDHHLPEVKDEQKTRSPIASSANSSSLLRKGRPARFIIRESYNLRNGKVHRKVAGGAVFRFPECLSFSHFRETYRLM